MKPTHVGKFSYYAYTAKGFDNALNPYPEDSDDFYDWHQGYTDAYLDQSRSYLAMEERNLAMFFGIDLTDPILLKVKPL